MSVQKQHYKDFEVCIANTSDFCRSLKILKNLKTTLRLFVSSSNTVTGVVLETLSKDFSYYFRSNVHVDKNAVHIRDAKQKMMYVGIIDICIMQVIVSHTNSKKGIRLYRYNTNPSILFIEDMDDTTSSQVSTVEVELSGPPQPSKLQQLKFDYLVSIRLIDLLQVLSIAINKQINGRSVKIEIKKQEGVEGLITVFEIQGNKKCMIKKTFGHVDTSNGAGKVTTEFESTFSVFRMYKFLKSLDNTSSFVVLKLSKETPLLIMSKCPYSESMVSMLIPKDADRGTLC